MEYFFARNIPVHAEIIPKLEYYSNHDFAYSFSRYAFSRSLYAKICAQNRIQNAWHAKSSVEVPPRWVPGLAEDAVPHD
jgi:hypothetical protein